MDPLAVTHLSEDEVIKVSFVEKVTTYLTAGFFDLRKARASLDACATKAACLGSFRLPLREVLGFESC